MNGYQQYKEQSIMTMTQGELLLLLYDELMKRLKRSEIALDTDNYELFDQSVVRSVEIVNYLKDTLNRDYAISAELRNMYDFFIFELSRLQAGRKKEVIQELQPLVKDLRDAFAAAEKSV
ncbi:MAG: flagellar export chaperone FliS [Muricomes sp.]